MSHEIPITHRICVKRAGIAVIMRLLIGSVLFLLLNSIFMVPRENFPSSMIALTSNHLLFIVVICLILVMSFLILPLSFAMNNSLKIVQKNLSKTASSIKLIEGLLFIFSMILLFTENGLYKIIFSIDLIFYGIHLLVIGILIIKSGFLNKIIGISLSISGLFGYLTMGFLYLSFDQIGFLLVIFVAFAIIIEMAFGFNLILIYIQLNRIVTDPKETVIAVLNELGEASTSEIVEIVSRRSKQCKDRIPKTLIILEKENKIVKKISKERKAIVWSTI